MQATWYVTDWWSREALGRNLGHLAKVGMDRVSYTEHIHGNFMADFIVSI